MICFEVGDSGPGIAPDEQETLFEPFVQTTAGQLLQEGTGLGLTISRQHVRLMGGDISLESVWGEGSIFRFTIPCTLVAETAVPDLQPARHVIGVAPGQPCYRLLVADDQASNRQLLVKILAWLGFEVRQATNGQEAIAIWQVWQPHLIWMDMRMPVVNGFEATRQIKSSPQGEATIIVALTASGMEEDRAMILSQGCDDYIRKPFYEEDIYQALARHLGVRFVYEDDAGKDVHISAPAEKAIATTKLAARLMPLPPDLIASMEQAALLGDIAAIEASINQIRRYDPVLADTMAMWAQNFEYDRISALIQPDGEMQHES